jgi:FtsP/CotA-like multicopper oxidase with cupredoxin domain
VTGRPLSRRHALVVLGAGAVGLAAGTTGWTLGAGAPAGGSPGASGQPLTEPVVLDSRDGVLEATLTASPGVRLAGRDTAAWGFNGTSPGPTLRVRPGDLLRLHLVNQVPQDTNLHTHGLHVSPRANGDNPFITVAPQASFDYEIRLPADHPPGTYWYHPHHHGTVADQIFAGLVGALLVDGGPDLAAHDRLLLVTDTTLDADGGVAAVDTMARMMGREGALVLVNGQHQPVLTAAPGALQRWRIINGCTARVLDLRLDGHQFTQIALDGRFLPAPAPRDRVVLAPGNRADLLVHPAENGRYALRAEPYNRGSMPMMGGDPVTSDPVTLATLAITGSPVPSTTPPATLPAPPAPAGPVTHHRQLIFAMEMAGMGMGGMRFTIDGRAFDPARDDQIVALGGIEEWTVVNTSPMDHPFHLHVWPVQVLGDNTGTPPSASLQDVVLVPAHGWIRLRIPFTDHPGRSVYHCHVLDHEDLGMMATIDVRR